LQFVTYDINILIRINIWYIHFVQIYLLKYKSLAWTTSGRTASILYNIIHGIYTILNFKNHTCKAQFINRTTRSNCWCSSIALFPWTCCASSVHKANLAALHFNALNTAGNVLRASEILFSNIQFTQFRNT